MAAIDRCSSILGDPRRMSYTRCALEPGHFGRHQWGSVLWTDAMAYKHEQQPATAQEGTK